MSQSISPRAAPHSRTSTGFTLIELLVAITLMALVSLIAWRGLENVANLRDRLDDNARETDALVRMLGQLERDLTMRAPDMVLQPATAAQSGGVAVMPRTLPLAVTVHAPDYAADAPRLHIVRAVGTMPGFWQQVEWWHEDGTLWRAVGEPAAQYPLPQAQSPTPVMHAVRRFSVNGWAAQTGWVPLPRPADVNTPINGVDIIVQLQKGDESQIYHRMVAFE